MKIGSGDCGELTFLDSLAIIGFCVGLQNLDLNLAQEDLDNQTQELDARLKTVVDDIHRHLKAQDAKIDMILEALK
jgi:hypothetical protein